MKNESATIQMKANEQDISVILFITMYTAVLTVLSLWMKLHSAIRMTFSFGAVCFSIIYNMKCDIFFLFRSGP